MKKRNKKYKPKRKDVAALISRFTDKWHFECIELMTVDAFKRGLAEDRQMHLLEDWANLICIANRHNLQRADFELEKTLCGLVCSILSRAMVKGSYALNFEEREALPIAIAQYQYYWKLRDTGVFNQCLVVLNVFYKERTELVMFNGIKIHQKEELAA